MRLYGFPSLPRPPAFNVGGIMYIIVIIHSLLSSHLHDVNHVIQLLHLVCGLSLVPDMITKLVKREDARGWWCHPRCWVVTDDDLLILPH